MGIRGCCFAALIICSLATAQGGGSPVLITQDSVRTSYDPNRPTQAAFYSAVLPGLGQAYNDKYWKIPIIYGGFATFIAIYLDQDQEYQRVRDAYKNRLAGRFDDPFISDEGDFLITTDGLERSQQTLQRNKELILLLTAAWYALNVIDANVDGHLSQFNTDSNLSLKPMLENMDYGSYMTYGLTLNYTF